MKQISTLKLYAFLGLLLFGSVKGNSQTTCTGLALTNCVPPTDQFNTNTFGPISGNFEYNQGNAAYSVIGGNTRGGINIISYTLTVQSNIFSVGAQITSGLARLDRTAFIRILDPVTNALICQAQVQIQDNGCLTAQFGGLAGRNVRVGFRFSKTANGGVIFDNFGTEPAQVVLPVTFIGFEGKKLSKGIELTWKVAEEVNVKEYEVERSSNRNGGFVKIGSIPATGASSYAFTDARPQGGVSVYRIKNVDNDGKFKYSTVVSFDLSTGIRVLPTLVTSKTAVEHDAAKGTESITLSTADGRLVRSLRAVAGSMKTTVEMSDLRPGMYLLKYNDGNGTVKTTKLMKQ